jgi:isocitrate dehydrogenase
MTKEISSAKKITVAFGDGIGPEIMESTLSILQKAQVNLDISTIEVGKKIYEKGFDSGLMPSAWESLNNSKVLLKAPITTPQGGGYKSLNVTLRKKLGLFANIRPVSSFYPFIATKFENMDLVIIRENEEDLYAGIEHRQTENSYQCLKIVTRQGCEKIIRYAFEYAVKNNRKKVSCFSKDNIMKMTDGLFHKIFDQIAAEYPQIITDHFIIDIGTAKIAAKPEIFDVIVTMNLYGDIISDVAAEISGSVGLAGSANIGSDFAMFEAIHGSAPDIASQNIANPTGLINAAVMMLIHLNEHGKASLIRNALYKTIEDGIHTADIFNNQTSSKKVSTSEFTKAVIDNLGNKPKKLKIADFKIDQNDKISSNEISQQKNITNEKTIIKADRKLIGFDLFIDWQSDLTNLIDSLKKLESDIFEIKTISSMGMKLWPFLDDHNIPVFNKGLVVLRFIGKNITKKNSKDIINKNLSVSKKDLIEMFNYMNDQDFDFVKYEGLYTFDSIAEYTASQGE